MIVWSVFAVGGVYVWAGVPLMIAAVAAGDVRASDAGRAARHATARRPADRLGGRGRRAARSVAACGAGGRVSACRWASLGDVPGTAERGRLAADFGRAGVDGVCVRARADRARGVLGRESGLRARHDAANRAHGRLRGPRRRTDRDRRQGARRPGIDLRTMAAARSSRPAVRSVRESQSLRDVAADGVSAGGGLRGRRARRPAAVAEPDGRSSPRCSSRSARARCGLESPGW